MKLFAHKKKQQAKTPPPTSRSWDAEGKICIASK